MQGTGEEHSRERFSRHENSGVHASVLALQQSAGNRAVSALVQGNLPPVVQSVIGSGGNPIEPDLRAHMESRFGQDFGHVRLHTDARAADSAEALRAKAYTLGDDVVFGPGRYAPDASEGMRLLAHELSHVVQHRRGTGSTSEYAGAETEAKHAGAEVASGESVNIRSDGAGGLQLAPKDDDDPVLRAFMKQKQKKENPPMGSPDWVRRFQGQPDSPAPSSGASQQGSSPAATTPSASAPGDDRAHTSPPKPVDPMAPFRKPMTKEEMERLRARAVEQQKRAEEQKKADEAARQARQAQEKQKQDAATRAAAFRAQYEKSQQAPPLFLSMLGPGYVQAYYRNPSGSIQDPLLRQQADLTTAAAAGHGALGTTALAVGTGVVAASTLLLLGSITLPVVVAISLEAAAGSATLTPVVTLIISNPMTVTEVAQFGFGIVLSMAAAGGVKAYLEQLSTPEGAVQAAFDLAVLHGTIRSTSGGAPRSVTGKGKVEKASTGGISVRIVEPFDGADAHPVPPKSPKEGGGTGAHDAIPPPPPTGQKKGSRGLSPNVEAPPPGKSDVTAPVGQQPGKPAPTKPDAAQAGKPADITEPPKPSEQPKVEGPAPKPKAVTPAEATQPDTAGKQKVGEPPPPSSEAPLGEAAKARRTAELQQRRSENNGRIAALEAERDTHEQRRVKYQAQADQRRAARTTVEDDSDVATKQRQASNEARIRDDKQSEIARLKGDNERLKREIDDINRPPATSPQLAGRDFEKRNAINSGMPKNTAKHKTSFPDASAPDGNRIPDYLPEHDGKGGWKTAANPADAEFAADSKLIKTEGKVNLTPQIKGFVEIAAKTRQRVLMLVTGPKTEISPAIYEFAKGYNVQVFPVQQSPLY